MPRGKYAKKGMTKMEAPRKGLSQEDLNEAVRIHCRQMYEEAQTGWICKGCGAEVQFTPCHVSVHCTPPGGMCSGFGNVEKFPLPYCPSCEGMPASTSTCVHIGSHRKLRPGSGIMEVTEHALTR